MNRMSFSRTALLSLLGLLSGIFGASACQQESNAQPDGPGGAGGEGGSAAGQHAYITSSVVLSDEGESTYVSLLENLEPQSIDLGEAIEFPGWAGVWVSGEKVFVSDGESPKMTRYAVGSQEKIDAEGSLSFANEGADYAESVFVGPNKAYVFADEAIVWDPTALAITGHFELPDIEDRAGGMEYSGVYTGRSLVQRGNRIYASAHWANWTDYEVSEDSLIVVIDTDEDRVIKTIPVDCPYFDFASVDDTGHVYFSNWVYSVGQTILQGKRKACAVRILPGSDELDPDWSLTFADVTGGREGAALYPLGDGKAIFSVFYEEEVDSEREVDMSTLVDGAYWRFWLLDLENPSAEPIDDIDFHAGGFGASRIDGQTFVLVPSSDYASTSVYAVGSDGQVELRWNTTGWSTQIVPLR